MSDVATLETDLQRIVRGGLTLGGVAGLLCVAGYFTAPGRFFSAYLTAYMFWLEIALGCLVLAMLHGLTGGGWGRCLRRVFEAGYQTLPLLFLLLAPILLGAGQIYEWADPEAVRHLEVLARKARYLNLAGFQIRAVVYFALWVVISWFLDRFSPNLERENDSTRIRQLQLVSGLGLIVYAFSVTLACVDWMMSLEPEWYSTMYGVIRMAGAALAGLSFVLVLNVRLVQLSPWSKTVTTARLNDLGNLLMTFTVFWTYVAFMQFLIIWLGNLPEENVWYLRRIQGGWEYLAFLLIGLQFGVPFALLLSRSLKRDPVRLARVAGLLLVMRYVELYWTIVPGFGHLSSFPQGLALHWLDLAAWAALGGVWLAMFAWRLRMQIQVPLFDPELTEIVHERSTPAAVE